MKIEFTKETVLQALVNYNTKYGHILPQATVGEITDELFIIVIDEDDWVDVDNIKIDELQKIKSRIANHLHKLSKDGLVFKQRSPSGKQLFFKPASPRDIVVKRLS